jgi:cytochrome c peroxidase
MFLFLLVAVDAEASPASRDETCSLRSDEGLRPLPRETKLDPAKVALGATLFADRRLSGDQTVACTTCHDLKAGGADSKPVSVGSHSLHTTRNTPTVFNVGFNFRQLWDGRADTLEAQLASGAMDLDPEKVRTLGRDLGRFSVTGREEDRHMFKVPSLRNIAATAPYYHDGSVPTLEAAVDLMASSQLGRELSATEIDEVTSFLRTLNGRYEGRQL